MKSAVWNKAIKESAAPERARTYFEALARNNRAVEKASAQEARILCALFSGSQVLSDRLSSHPELLEVLAPENLAHPRRAQGLRRETQRRLQPFQAASDYAAGFSWLREFKQREMLRIAARDLARLGPFGDILLELSDVADVCLSAVWELCQAQAVARFGLPFHQDAAGRWQPTAACVLGLGKLGGQELNYSSDVDVIFVYSDEGQVFRTAPGRKTASGGLPNHQFFNRLAERFVAEISALTGEGALYRIDLRLRPEGEAGPLSRSLPGYENYYAQWGQTWERMMLIKARCVAGDAALAAEFLEMIQPFRYPRSLGQGVFREVAAMKDRMEAELLSPEELDRNVKLGRGGIREIEFVAQSLQLLHGGRLPFLQGGQTVPALHKLAEYDLLEGREARSLGEAYVFLRDVEHRLQMEDNRQTHLLPASTEARERVGMLMGFRRLADFEAARAEHTRAVRAVYDRLFKAGPEAPRDRLPAQIEGDEARWRNILAERSFINPEQSLRLLNEFVFGPGYIHVSNRTSGLALDLLAKMLALCPKTGVARPRFDPAARVLSDPDRVLTRLDGFIAAYGARATLFETWNANPTLFELLLLLFDRSEFLAETAIHTPDLVDELVLSGRLRQRKSSANILDDLRHGKGDADQRLWLRRYHQAELMRIGLRDILGIADFEQNLAELSGLADACLQYALEVVLRKRRWRGPSLAILGLGKLGGGELNYGSDLDILFVTDAPVAALPGMQKLAVEIMDLISARTEAGITFALDARLRPDGEKGLLINTLDAYEDYYRRRAKLWEIQALSRVRHVAGDGEIGSRLVRLAGALANFSARNIAQDFTLPEGMPGRARKPSVKRKSRKGLAAYSPGWRKEIAHMRERIEKERTPAGRDDLAIKTGSGGLMDAEFAAQTLSLAHGWREAGTLPALMRARDEGELAREDLSVLIDNYRELRRIEGILRRWSLEGETILPMDDPAYYRVSVRCGFGSPEDFREALAGWRQGIRRVYRKVLCA